MTSRREFLAKAGALATAALAPAVGASAAPQGEVLWTGFTCMYPDGRVHRRVFTSRHEFGGQPIWRADTMWFAKGLAPGATLRLHYRATWGSFDVVWRSTGGGYGTWIDGGEVVAPVLPIHGYTLNMVRPRQQLRGRAF